MSVENPDAAAPPKMKAKLEAEELDMTPMVDVTFLLLIFFMITAAFALQKSLEVPPVKDDEASTEVQEQDPETDSIVVRVDEDNIYWVAAPTWEKEEKALSKAELLVQLRKAKESQAGNKGGEAAMLVRAHGDSVHEKVVSAIDSGMAAGMTKIQMMKYEDGDY